MHFSSFSFYFALHGYDFCFCFFLNCNFFNKNILWEQIFSTLNVTNLKFVSCQQKKHTQKRIFFISLDSNIVFPKKKHMKSLETALFMLCYMKANFWLCFILNFVFQHGQIRIVVSCLSLQDVLYPIVATEQYPPKCMVSLLDNIIHRV